VHYVGTLLSDGSKFDSSRDRPGNFKFTLGNGQVIKGWDKGVATMHKGEKAELFCRADYAYGETGSPPKIPGGATLKFEVELLSWGEPKKERWEMSAAEKLEEAKKLKAEGGGAFKEGEWQAAQDKYTSAVEWVEHDYDFSTEDEKAAARELHVSCLLNAAQCALKCKEWPEAASSCTKALAVAQLPDASKVKALFRRGTARIKMADFADARTPRHFTLGVLLPRPLRSICVLSQARTFSRLARWTPNRRRFGICTPRSRRQRRRPRKPTPASLQRW